MKRDEGRFTCMMHKIRDNSVITLLRRERLVIGGTAANLAAVAMVVIHGA